MKRIVIVILCLIVPVICCAQDINIVCDLMNKGHYEDALTIIEGLNVVQNDRYSEDLARIERIKNLYKNALSYYKKDYYSRAITNYEEIIKIYNSLSFYVDKSFINSKISVCKKARAEYLQKQQEKLLAEERERARQDSIRRVREQARQVWEETLRANTIDAYERYLKNTARQSDENGYYRQIAITNLRSVYVRAAMGNYLENNFVEAYWYFNKLETKYGDLNSSEQAIYDTCRMERDYRSLLSVDTPPYWYEDFLKQLEKGVIDFDVLISTPAYMPKLGKYARLLGPKGLMPNPKAGTVTNDVEKAVSESKAGKVEYRVDKQSIVHIGLGKVSFGTEKLLENAEAFLESLKAQKPTSIKGSYVKSVYIATTMGPSIAVENLYN